MKVAPFDLQPTKCHHSIPLILYSILLKMRKNIYKPVKNTGLLLVVIHFCSVNRSRLHPCKKKGEKEKKIVIDTLQMTIQTFSDFFFVWVNNILNSYITQVDVVFVTHIAKLVSFCWWIFTGKAHSNDPFCTDFKEKFNFYNFYYDCLLSFFW